MPGNKLVYKNEGTGAVIVPNVGDSLTGYTDLPNNGIISAADGDKIAVAEVDADDKVVKFGQTTAVVVDEPAAPVDAAPPTIDTQPTGDEVSEGSTPIELKVEATGSGTLSYQWFRNSVDSNAGGFALNGQTSASYTVATGAARDDYFYVEVTNTDTSVSGNQTASVRSETAHVVVNELADAAPPTIDSQPVGDTANVGAASIILSVAATTNSGTLSYQWYRNNVDSNAGGFALNGQTNDSYTVATGAARDDYFYVVVTNTDTSVEGNQTASVRSATAHVVVNGLVDATPPTIDSQPVGDTANEGAASIILSVAATTNSGTLSYQWYRNSVDSNAGGIALNGQTSATYTVTTAAARDDYYYVEVTNTDTSVSGNKTASVRSETAHVVVNGLVDATPPTIGTQPVGDTANVGAASIILSVTATTNSGTLSYQWYRNSVDSNAGGFALNGQTSATYTVTTAAARDDYYYVEVTNTDTSVLGNQTASVRSATAHVVVNGVVDATPPTIETQPVGDTANEGAASIILSVAATTNSGTLSYQWYRNSVDSNAGGFALNGQTSASYTVTTGAARDDYYYVEVTNTDTSVSGNKTASVRSETAHVVVNELVDAETPTITLQPVGATVPEAEELVLEADASVSDGGTLSYQWVRNSTNSMSGGAFVVGATGKSFSVPTSTANDVYYFVRVTNTNDDAPGVKTALALSDVVHVVIEDVTQPTVAITSNEPNPTNDSSFNVTMTFSEPVTGLGISDLNVTNGSASGLQTSNNLIYTATITPVADGETTVSINADAAVDKVDHGNIASNVLSIVYDSTSPTVAIATIVSATTNESTFPVTVTFSEAVVGFNLSDIAVLNGSASSFQTVDDTTYTAIITPTADGAVTVSVSANVASDEAGNGSLAATPLSITYDATAPTVSLASSESNLTNQSPFQLSIVFSEEVLGFELGDIEVTGGSADNLQAISGSVYTVDILPSGDGDITVEVAAGIAIDNIGNDNTAATPFSITFDGTAPLIVLNGDADLQHEAGTAFVDPGTVVTDNYDAAISDALVVTGSVDTTTLGDYELKYNADDAAGNSAIEQSRQVHVLDTMKPVITLNGDQSQQLVLGETYTEAGAAAEDSFEGDVSSSITIQGTVDTAVPGIYTLTYTAQDSSGNSASVERTVQVLSNDNALQQLTISQGELSPAFTPNELAYTAKVGYGVRKLTISLRANDAHAAIAVNGQALTPDGNGLAEGEVELNIGNNEVNIEITAEDGTTRTYTLSVRRSAPPAQSNSTGVVVLVNGKPEYTGVAITSYLNGQQVTRVIVNEQQLLNRLEAAGEQAMITIPVHTNSDVAIAELNGRMIKSMEESQAVLEIRTENASYTLPASQIDIDAIWERLGTEPNLQDIKIKIEIGTPLNEMQLVVQDAVNQEGLTIAVPPVNFKVTAEYGDQTVEVTAFNAYVERAVAIPDSVDPNRITTGVVVEPDGTVRHVPTKVIENEGDYYAQISSLTNSTYAVVWHPVSFEDMAKHWAMDAVNDMGSRMIVEGVSDGTFGPDRAITRAEFAAIVVRALGLRIDMGETDFLDVKASAWYAGAIATAHSFGLIDGFEDGTFRPDEKLTREQAMLVIAKAMHLTGLLNQRSEVSSIEAISAFQDAQAISSWAIEGIAESLKAGIVTGRDGQLIAPQAEITRAEVATIVKRLLEKSDLI